MTLKVLVFIISCLTHSVFSELAKVSLVNAQNQEENRKGDHRNVALNSKTANFNLEDVYNKGANNIYSQANEGGNYDVINNDKNHHLDRSNFSDQNFNQQEGGAVSNLNKNLAHKKGHHNSGFHNTYHKDESSNKSSFYDDNDEEGGEFAQNARNRAYGNKQASNDGVSHFDNSLRLKGNQERGDYVNVGNNEKRFGNNNKNYNEDYYSDRENLGNVRQGNRHGLSGNYYQQQLHQQYPPLYYQPPIYDGFKYENNHRPYNRRILFNAYNHPEKKTITVYEDPRFYQHNSDYTTYKNPDFRYGNVELNVLPPFKSHHYSNYDFVRPTYDYDYY